MECLCSLCNRRGISSGGRVLGEALSMIKLNKPSGLPNLKNGVAFDIDDNCVQGCAFASPKVSATKRIF